MKIFGNPMSTCTRKVITTLEEKKAPYEFVVIDFAKGGHKAPEHMARQPFGQVPALEDGDFRMYESRAMIRYIDETVAGTSLTPKDAKGRARMEQWMSVEQSNFTPAAMSIIYQTLLAPMQGGTPDAAKIAEGRAKLKTSLDVLETHLGKSQYFVGDQFTLADICYMPYVEYLMMGEAKEDIVSHPKVEAWWKRVSARPTWQKAAGKA